MGEMEAPQVDLAKMAVDRQKGLEEGFLDLEFGSCHFLISASFFCEKTSRRQTRNPRLATSAGSEVVGVRVPL